MRTAPEYVIICPFILGDDGESELAIFRRNASLAFAQPVDTVIHPPFVILSPRQRKMSEMK